MAGLINKNFKEEILTELSWIKNAIDEISEKLKIETYETILIKYRIEPEEEKAIDKFFVFHYKKLNQLKTEEKQRIISKYFCEMTNKKWSMNDETLEKILEMKIKQLEKVE